MEKPVQIYNEDCLDTAKKIADKSVHLGIFDPPFGIGESKFDQHYKRDTSLVIQGYQEAPADYSGWTLNWMTEAKRVLHDNGSMWIIIGHSKLRDILNAAHELDLHEINHLVWKFNFGVNTKCKFVTSHYHVLYYSKSAKAKPLFNLNCRFGSQERTSEDKSALFADLEDVWTINKDYAPKEAKNQNKLPEALIQKIIQYSSNPGDLVCDFFMGNFTTAYMARKLGRNVCGYEINPLSYDYHFHKVEAIEFGGELTNLKKVVNIIPENQGKTISQEEIANICDDYLKMLELKTLKKDINKALQEKYGRGQFAIKNILDAANVPKFLPDKPVILSDLDFIEYEQRKQPL